MTEAAEFDGEIIGAFGTDGSRILLEKADGGRIFAECSTELIDRVASHDRNSSFRIIGYATWERSEAGYWELIRFQATSFRPLRVENLIESIARLREILSQ